MLLKLSLLMLLLGMLIHAAESSVRFEELFNTLKERDYKTKSLQLMIDSKERSIEAQTALSPTEVGIATSDLGADEFSVSVGQEFELGSLKKHRKTTLLKEQEVLSSQIELRSLELENELGTLYIDAYFNQQRVHFLDSLIVSMKKSAQWVDKSITVGAGAKIDLMRMNLDILKLEFYKSQFITEFEALVDEINTLCATTVSKQSIFILSIDRFYNFSVTSTEKSSPLQKMLEAQVLVEQSKVEEQRVPKINALFIEGGFTRNNVDKETHGDLNIGISLPLFSKISSSVEAQNMVVEATRKDAAATKLEVDKAKIALVNNIKKTKKEIEFIDSKMIPKTQEVLNEMKQLIQNGIFSFIDYQQNRREFIQLSERKFELQNELGKKILNLKIYNGDLENVIK